jgi:hypothetical protein
MLVRSDPARRTSALSYDDARFDRAIAALLVTFAACSAAFAAHVAIDALGDVLLARDAYDHVAHGSRAVALGVAMLVGLGMAWQAVRRAFEEALGRKASPRASLQRICRGSKGAFVARVVPLTIVVLAAMGLGDASLDGSRVDDLADLFGGSIALSLGVTIAAAIGAAIGAWALLRCIAASHRMIVCAIVALISLVVRARPGPALSRADGSGFTHRNSNALLARRFGKRGPPPPLT